MAAGLMIGLAITLTLLLGGWLYLRRRAGTPPGDGAPDNQAKLEAVAASVSVPCPGCGKNLKARAELAGKKVKCPRCGQAVPVPVPTIDPPAAIHAAPAGEAGLWQALKKWGVLGCLALVPLALFCGWRFWLYQPKKPALLNVSLGNEFVAGVEESGFHVQEIDRLQHPFRWTNGNARLVVPLDKASLPQAVRIELAIHRPPPAKKAALEVVVNGHSLFKNDVAVGSWQKTLDLRDLDLGEQLTLELLSDSFVPLGKPRIHGQGINDDDRALGVQVFGITLLAATEKESTPAAPAGDTVGVPLRAWQGHSQSIACGAVTPDGKTLVSGDWGGTIKIWNIAAGKERTTLHSPAPGLQALAVSPDGKTFATAASDRVVRVWNIATGGPRTDLRGHAGEITALAYSPDGQTLASAGGNRFQPGELKLWDLATGAERVPVEPFKLRLWGLAYAPDGKSVAVPVGDGTAQTVDTATGKVLATFTHPSYAHGVTFSPDGQLLAVGYGDEGDVHIHELESGKLRSHLQAPAGNYVGRLEFARDGKLLLAPCIDGTTLLWDVSAAEARAPAVLKGHEGPVRFAVFFPDGKTVATGGEDLAIRLWRVAGAEAVANPEGGPGAGTKLKTGYAREYHHSFKGDRDLSEGLQWDGIDPAGCVQFEPEGLRLELPTDHPGRRIGTGLCTNFTVQGDFEITITYEIIKEPGLADAGLGTGVYLWVDADKPGMHRAVLTRGGWATRQYSYWTWLRLDRDGPGQPPLEEFRYFPAASKSGRLRLVRTGPLLSHYVAEGPGKEFVFLRQHVFGTDDLKYVRIGGHTGGPKAALDARFTDLHIRAGSLPDVPEPALASSEKAGTGWLYAGLVIGLLFACSLALGGWLFVRQRRRAAEPPARAAVAAEPAKPEPEAVTVSVTCSTCGKKLKARAELAGKRVKCPQCGQAVLVPSIQVGAP